MSVDLSWKEYYALGIDEIDEDHKQLLSIMKSLSNAAKKGDLRECDLLSDQLLEAAKKHFKTEEEFLERVKFPRLEDHKAYHQTLLVQAQDVKDICSGKNVQKSLEECIDSMEGFLINDIIMGDLDFKSYVKHFADKKVTNY